MLKHWKVKIWLILLMFESQLFVTGIFRSGTTLLARMLNTHKSICMASDPFAPIFKCFRNEIAQKKKGGFFDNHSPLNDYYFNDEQKILFKSIQSQNFNIPLKIYNIDTNYYFKKLKYHSIYKKNKQCTIYKLK